LSTANHEQKGWIHAQEERVSTEVLTSKRLALFLGLVGKMNAVIAPCSGRLSIDLGMGQQEGLLYFNGRALLIALLTEDYPKHL
jgi:hypothetical protein